jgi:hypothetical protein
MSATTAVPTSVPIAGVMPAQTREVTIMSVWPSIAMFGPGRFLGRWYAKTWPDIYIFRLGNLIALVSIPFALVLYAMRVFIRYRLTNRRIVVERGPSWREAKSVEFDRFSTIDLVVRPGQAWYDAGDLVFRQGNVETFRLEGVSRPAAFRETCLKAHLAYKSIKEARQRQGI